MDLTLGIETSRCRTGCRNLPEGARFNQVTAFLFLRDPGDGGSCGFRKLVVGDASAGWRPTV